MDNRFDNKTIEEIKEELELNVNPEEGAKIIESKDGECLVAIPSNALKECDKDFVPIAPLGERKTRGSAGTYLTNASTSGTFGSSPSCYWELYAESYSSSDGLNVREIWLRLGLKVNGSSSSRYGYPAQCRVIANGSYSGWVHVKGNEMWYGSDSIRYFSAWTTTNVGTSSDKWILCGFQVDIPGYNSSWDVHSPQQMGMSAGQVLTRPDTVTGLTVSGLFEEGETQTIKWNAMPRTDYYKVFYKVWTLGGGGWSGWLQHGGNISGTSYSITHNNVGGNKYGAIFYCVNAYNAAGVSPDNQSATTEHYGVRVWNGSAWVWGQMRVWNGSSWVKSVPQAWTGSAWKFA